MSKLRKKLVSRGIGLCAFGAGAMVGSSPLVAHAADVCPDNPYSGPDICVSWTGTGDPIHGTDFAVDYDCTGCDTAPALKLLVGGTDANPINWTVYSRTQTETPGAIGTISIDATTLTHDFDLKILSPTGAGATDVGKIDLKHPNSLWAGHSSIVDGDISGDLGGLTLVQDSSGNGGRLNLTVCGDAGGVWTVPILEALTIGGDVRSGAAISIGNTPDITPDAFLTVEGDCAGDITEEEKVSGRFLDILNRIHRICA